MIVIYYARILGKADFGMINLVQSILVYCNMITLFGFQTYGAREVAKDKSKTNNLVSDIISIRIIISIICFIALIFIGIFSNKGYSFQNLLFLYGLSLFPLAFNIDWVFSGIQEMQHNAMYSVIKNIVPFILMALFLREKSQIYLIPIFSFLGVFLGIIYQIYIYKVKNKFDFKLFPNLKIRTEYIKASLPFFISGLLSMINCNIDSIIIGYMRSNAELGLYSAAYKIVFFLTNVIAMIFMPLFPIMIEYYEQNNKKSLDKLMNLISKIIIMLAFPICIGGIILSKKIILLLFGKQYIESYHTLAILMIYIFLLFMRETYGYALNAWNMENKYLKVVLISSITNLILNLIFIPKYGIEAAACTTVFSEIINYILMQKYAFKIAKTNYRKYSLQIILFTFIMAVGIVFMKNLNVIINILISICIYFICIIGFKYLSLSEIKGFFKKNN